MWLESLGVLLGLVAALAAADPQAPQESVEGQIAKGEACLQKGDHQGALNAFSAVILKDPNHVEAQVGRAAALIGLSDAKKAIESARLATQLDPKNARGWYQLGLARMLEGTATPDYPAAETALGKALELEPGRLDFGLALARALNYQKKVDASIALQEELLARHPDSIPLKVKLAESYYAREKLDRAEALLAEVLAKEPSHPDALRVRREVESRRSFYVYVLVGAAIIIPAGLLLVRLSRRGRVPRIKES